MEASTIPATAAPAAGRPAAGRLLAGPLLRLRSDEQLVRLFRAGSEDAFRVVHDRYRTRLLAYARQMLGASRADADDVLQDVFVRAYAALRANDRDVSLRAWLYRIAHNRCIDELRRPAGAPGAPPDALEALPAPGGDPSAAVERRESLRRLVEDVRRLPEQQRSALLMREISGMPYQDLAAALDVTVPAVKSLLVRARIGLAQAAEARDTACAAIRADLADAHERGVRASGLVRRHLHDCKGCNAYRRELRALDARLAALVPALGPVALLAKLLGIGGGGAAAGGGVSAAGGASAVAAGAAAATAGAGAGAAGIGVSHVVAAIAVVAVSAGGAVEVQRTLGPGHHRTAAERRAAAQAAPPARAATFPDRDPFAAVTPQTEAARRADAARRLRLRIAPAVVAAPALPGPTEPALDLGATEPGNGGVAAPQEPALAPLDPAVPPAAPAPPVDAGGEAPAAGGTGAPATGATPPASGSTTVPPAPPADAGPAAPAGSAPPAPSTPAPPPSPATVGGATYPGR